MDKNPKHPLKKKKAVQKVCATANHNAQEVEAAAPSQRNILIRVNKSTNKEKVPRICL